MCYMACDDHTPRDTGQIVGGPDTGLACCTALNCPSKGKGCKCVRTTVMGSGIIECHCDGNCGGDDMVGLPYMPNAMY